MNLRTIASFAIALFLGLIAVVLVRNYLAGAKGNAGAGPSAAAGQMGPVVVAAVPIARGATLQPAMLKVVNYPRASLPAGAFQTVDQLSKAGAPRTAMRSIAPNEPVLVAKLSGAGGKTNLSGTLTPGMRAVSIRSSDVAGVGGFVLPGDRVDVLLTRTAGAGDHPQTLIQALAENALVLAVDQSNDVENDKPVVAKAVTLEVTPDQAQAVTLAQSVGTVSLSLRQVADAAPLARRVTTVADLGGLGRAAAPARAASAKPGKGAVRPAVAPDMIVVRVTRGVETAGYPVSIH
jgi:pilus assembly protein CpaB